jgi:hypothetical protein
MKSLYKHEELVDILKIDFSATEKDVLTLKKQNYSIDALKDFIVEAEAKAEAKAEPIEEIEVIEEAIKKAIVEATNAKDVVVAKRGKKAIIDNIIATVLRNNKLLDISGTITPYEHVCSSLINTLCIDDIKDRQFKMMAPIQHGYDSNNPKQDTKNWDPPFRWYDGENKEIIDTKKDLLRKLSQEEKKYKDMFIESGQGSSLQEFLISFRTDDAQPKQVKTMESVRKSGPKCS